SLLAFVNLVTQNELQETMEMLKRALASSPHEYDLMFMLAQLYLRKEDFTAARQLIDKIIANGDADVSQRAQRLLTQLVSVEEHLARIKKLQEEEAAYTQTTTGDSNETTTMRSIERPFDPAAALRESLRRPVTGETRTQGSLIRIDCDAKGITFVVKVGDRLLKLNTDTFQHANIMSFSEDAGNEITCGLRRTQNNVVVAYIPKTEPRAKIDGVLKSLEFVPPDFKLKP